MILSSLTFWCMTDQNNTNTEYNHRYIILNILYIYVNNTDADIGLHCIIDCQLIIII